MTLIQDKSGQYIEGSVDGDSANPSGKNGIVTTAIMYGRAASGVIRRLVLDATTWAMITIGYEHHEIHAGDHYNYCDYTALGLAAGAITNIVIQTADTDKLVHLGLEAYSATGATIELYEGATGVSGGTAIIPRNNRRDSINTSGATVLLNPTITTDGTRAAGFLAGAGRVAGFADRDKENILKRNTIYLARITSTAAQNRISWCMEWYEHTDKN